MARTSTKKVDASAPSSTNKQPTAAEMREWYEKNNIEQMKFAEAEKALKQLRDVTKTSTKTVGNFNKETLRTYFKNIGSQEKNFRGLSRYLYYRSQVYMRLIKYQANMLEMGARTVIPQYDMIEDNDSEAILKSYQETIDVLDKMNLDYEMLKAAIIAWREDCFFGLVYYDDTDFFILPLDPDICVISGLWSTSDFAYCVDMSYYRSRQTELEWLGSPLTEMYNDYLSTGIKYQQMPSEYSCCFKIRAEDWQLVLPPFAGLFNDLISLLDSSDVQAALDEQAVTNILQLPLETLSGSKNENDWKISPDIVLSYFDRFLNEALPPYATGVVVPGKIEKISLSDSDGTNDVNKIQENTKVLLNTSGGAQILNSSTISGTTAFTAAIQSDTQYALSPILPQIQAFVTRFLRHHVSNPCRVKFHEVSSYTKEAFKESLLKDAQYGLPTKLTINALNGFSEKETLSLSMLERDLGLTELFVPLNSSHTTSNDEGGRPTAKEKGETRTDDGEKDDDKQDNKK